MQTFLPYPSFADSARALDNKRLGKQRVECLQIIRALTIEEYGWKNHPAVKMWRGHLLSLTDYSTCITMEWINRGFVDTCTTKILDAWLTRQDVSPMEIIAQVGKPEWLGNPDFHLSHQSNLIRIFPTHYRPIFGDDVPDDLPYIWPVL